ncbi:MAG: tetratricopeptide repeat protein [Clostridia bacterium]|nr:tetratricopeptide repeat protein [Clostridia bacterium]
MKNKKLQAILVTFVSLLIFCIIGFYLYEVLYLKVPYDQHLYRTITTVFVLIGTIIKTCKGGRKRRKSLKFYEEAYKEHLGTAFDNQPRYRIKLLNACRLYDESNEKKAISELTKLNNFAITSRDYAAIWFFLGLCYSELELLTNAIESYRKTIEYDPNNASAHSNLGQILVNIGDFELAIHHFDKSIEADPNNYYAYNNKATAYFKLGDYEMAIKNATKALEFKNNGAEAASLLTIIYALFGDEENKQYYYHLAITSGKNPNSLNFAIQHFLHENSISEEEESEF